jgi:hypothetical protein
MAEPGATGIIGLAEAGHGRMAVRVTRRSQKGHGEVTCGGLNGSSSSCAARGCWA